MFGSLETGQLWRTLRTLLKECVRFVRMGSAARSYTLPARPPAATHTAGSSPIPFDSGDGVFYVIVSRVERHRTTRQ